MHNKFTVPLTVHHGTMTSRVEIRAEKHDKEKRGSNARGKEKQKEKS